MKKRKGAPMILFVLARKSAEASTTSIARFKEFHPQNIAIPTNNVRIAPQIPKTKAIFLDSLLPFLKK